MISEKKRQTTEAIKHFIRTNYRDPVDMNRVAKLVNYSAAYSQRVFKEVTGQSMTRFLQTCRIEQAKLLLERTDLKGYQVAYEVGYTSVSEFRELFKRYTGYTLRKYRLQYRKSQEWTSQAESILSFTASSVA